MSYRFKENAKHKADQEVLQYLEKQCGDAKIIENFTSRVTSKLSVPATFISLLSTGHENYDSFKKKIERTVKYLRKAFSS